MTATVVARRETRAPVGRSTRTRTAPGHHARLVALVDLVTLLESTGVRFAFQGARGAATTWVDAVGPADLDLWVASEDRRLAAAVLRSIGAVPVAVADDPDRLRHDVWGLLLASGPAVVDLTIGDLRVGPVVLAPEVDVDRRLDDDGFLGAMPRLAGSALVADLVLRPLLRGRLPAAPRLAEARAEWATLDADGRRRVVEGLGGGAGAELGLLVAAVLDGAPAPDGLAARGRRLLARRTARPRALRGAWRQRRSILPTRRPGPFGLRRSGSLVVLVGTDGSGKSTLARTVTAELTDVGYEVTPRYFGMARGNLPGVGLARRVLGVAPVSTEPGSTAPVGAAAGARGEVGGDVDGDADGGVEPVATHATLRRLAAWYYAAEYVWRYASGVAPALRRGDVVLCDRWVTDLRFGPAPGSRASRVVERIVRTPEVMVLPDAPPQVIHDRKPERAVEEIAAQQALLRSVLASQPSGCTTLLVDTSGSADRAHEEVLRAIVAATHRHHVGGGI